MIRVDLAVWDAMVAREKAKQIARYTQPAPAPRPTGNITYDLLGLLHVRLEEAAAESDSAHAAGDIRAVEAWERRGRFLGRIASDTIAEVKAGRADRSPVRTPVVPSRQNARVTPDGLSPQMKALLQRQRTAA